MFIGMMKQFVLVIGIFVPMIGVMSLLKKEQTQVSTNLLLTNIGCLVVNGCYLLMMSTKSYEAALQIYKMEYLGNILFYAFFILFIMSYLRLTLPHKVWVFWLVFEGIEVFVLWDEHLRRLIFKEIQLVLSSKGDYSYIVSEGGFIYVIRYFIICVMLIGLLLHTVLHMLQNKVKSERNNLRRLAVAQAVILASLILTLTCELTFDVVPICVSVAILFISLGVIQGEFFSVTDMGREWAFENIEDVFIIVDSMCGYLDANAYARKLFPELEGKKRNEPISEVLAQLFRKGNKEPKLVINGRYLVGVIEEFTQNGNAEGYCLIMHDVTRQYQLLEELQVEKENAEAANRAKSTFMSNMSHEIRTPMNAIVGMTEILLRGNLSEQEQGYLMNIKNSGAALLAIINDILDFSKIESGKLELVEVEYEPMSMLSDLSMMFLNRIGDKNIVLLFDIDSNIPMRMYGDSLRLRQVIINIMNNAIKFTEEGFVRLTMNVNKVEEDDVELYFSVEDTGQGIQQENLAKVFESFSQVDTRRNHEKEGTGLGLAISKQLVELMGGEIGLESEYGKGSTFYFTVHQKVRSGESAIQLKEALQEKPALISSYVQSPYLEDALKKLVAVYSLDYVEYEEAKEKQLQIDYLFAEDTTYMEAKLELSQLQNDKTEICVLHNPMQKNIWDNDVTAVNKPLYSLNFCQVLNHEMQNNFVKAEGYLNFAAPDAKVLIVDDNEMNLKVATGLLGPLEMQIDTAENGKKALQMIQEKQYDLIFMDHMMPVMDGIETTCNLREMEGEYYKNVPVIALTANAVIGAKDSFTAAGMNDFVAKPIEMKDICAIIKRWLPKEYIIRKVIQEDTEQSAEERNLPVIEGLDVAEGIKNCGTKELFLSLLGDFYKLIDLKATKLEKCVADGMLRDYTIEVHALKNTARMIGAMQLSADFFRMEQYGNEGNREAIEQETPAVLKLYRSYGPILKPFGERENQAKKAVEVSELIQILQSLEEAMDGFDLDGADAAMARLEECQIPEAYSARVEQLRAYVADVAMEEVMNITQQMIEELQDERR